MVDLCEDMEIGRVNELIQAKMNETGLVTRLIEHGITPKLVRIIRNSLSNGTDLFVNVRAKGETRIFWASDWDIERGEGSTAYELRFGEQEYTVNEMKQNIVILNKSDKPQHVLIELQEIEYVRPFPVSATTGF